ncbi:hypothetical protein [Gemmata obscuriglobus]|uniref:hypothetical protein n=1 Tax=Gemmata obscuriglobus TaxID=114 RepID=UPI00016C390D
MDGFGRLVPVLERERLVRAEQAGGLRQRFQLPEQKLLVDAAEVGREVRRGGIPDDPRRAHERRRHVVRHPVVHEPGHRRDRRVEAGRAEPRFQIVPGDAANFDEPLARQRGGPRPLELRRELVVLVAGNGRPDRHARFGDGDGLKEPQCRRQRAGGRGEEQRRPQLRRVQIRDRAHHPAGVAGRTRHLAHEPRRIGRSPLRPVGQEEPRGGCSRRPRVDRQAAPQDVQVVESRAGRQGDGGRPGAGPALNTPDRESNGVRRAECDRDPRSQHLVGFGRGRYGMWPR